MVLREMLCSDMFVLGVSQWAVRETEIDERMIKHCVEKPKRPALLPFVTLCPWSGGGWSLPSPFRFIAVIVRRKDSRNVCNAWRITPFFSGDVIDILLWALQLNASECDESIYENMF